MYPYSDCAEDSDDSDNSDSTGLEISVGSRLLNNEEHGKTCALVDIENHSRLHRHFLITTKEFHNKS